MVNVSGTYDIAAQYCHPTGPVSFPSLQILTHGIGFNASYWDFLASSDQSAGEYSYISAATKKGYSTISYSRLGISGSTLADPDKEVQTPVALAILSQITQLAREGGLFDGQPKPSKVFHVGHSYGSILANALVAAQPSSSDGLILTAYSHNPEYYSLYAANTNFLIASIADPARFPSAQYPNGYVTWPSQWVNQYNYFAYPNFDDVILELGEATKQPFPIAELLSFSLLNLDAPDFEGPVLYVNGEKDLIMCASNCTGMIQEGTAAFKAFRGTTDIESQVVSGAGHALHYHHGAQEMSGKMLDWVKRHDEVSRVKLGHATCGRKGCLLLSKTNDLEGTQI